MHHCRECQESQLSAVIERGTYLFNRCRCSDFRGRGGVCRVGFGLGRIDGTRRPVGSFPGGRGWLPDRVVVGE